MNSADVSGFFYNLIPGGLFIVGIKLLAWNQLDLRLLNLSDKPAAEFISFIVFIIFSLFLGFVFQGVTKLAREAKLNELVFSHVRSINSSQYKVAEDILKRVDSESSSHKDKFYLMDNYLRSTASSAGPIHFSSRFAFWSNIFVASIFYFFALLFFLKDSEQCYLYPITFAIFLFSFFLSWFYFKAYYDVVLKTFITKLQLQDYNNKRK